MKTSLKSLITLAAGTAVCVPSMAADMALKLTLPTINTNGGRPALRPYVAVWLRKADDSFDRNLAVWYETEVKARRGGPPGEAGAAGGAPREGGPPGEGGSQGASDAAQGGMTARQGGPPGEGGALPPSGAPGGARWLNESRQWWSDAGSKATFPIDGVSGASRAAGDHELIFSDGKSPLGKLPAGNYQLVVEVSREHGGLEAVSIPFSWPAKTAQTLTASGKTELGAVALTLKP